MFANISVNWWAVIIGSVIQMVTGMIWYNPKTPTGKMWMEANAMTADSGDRDKMGLLYFTQFVASLVIAYVTALFVAYVDPAMLKDGFVLVIWLWLGFLVAGSAGVYTFPPKPFKLFAMDSIYKLINMLLLVWLFMSWK